MPIHGVWQAMGRFLPAEGATSTLDERIVIPPSRLSDGNSHLGFSIGLDEIRAKLDCSDSYIARWRKRFATDRLTGLFARYAGRKLYNVTDRIEARVLAWTANHKPADGSTHWSSRKLAAELGDRSHMTVTRIWVKHGIKPRRLEGFLVSHDPEFQTKAAEVVGLYLNPPQHAAVVSVDEKTAIQALDRQDPVLPLSPGRVERHGFEYFRHGTLSLYAAFNTQTGEVIGKTAERHTSAEFVAFLTDIVAHQPKGNEIHLIVDNLLAHKTRRIGGDLCDPQLLQGAVHLGEPRLIDHAPGCLGVPVVRAAVDVERAEQPLRLNHLVKASKATHRPFFLHEEGRVEFARRIVQCHNEIPLTVRCPFMDRAVLIEHHARHRFARPLLAMCAAPRGARHLAGGPQPPLCPRVGACPAMLGLPPLAEMFDRPAVSWLSYSVTICRTSSTGTARAEARPSRRSSNPAAPSTAYRSRHRRNVRSLIPSISAASTIVSSRPRCRAYSSSNRIRLTSCNTLARVIGAFLQSTLNWTLRVLQEPDR